MKRGEIPWASNPSLRQCGAPFLATEAEATGRCVSSPNQGMALMVRAGALAGVDSPVLSSTDCLIDCDLGCQAGSPKLRTSTRAWGWRVGECCYWHWAHDTGVKPTQGPGVGRCSARYAEWPGWTSFASFYVGISRNLTRLPGAPRPQYLYAAVHCAARGQCSLAQASACVSSRPPKGAEFATPNRGVGGIPHFNSPVWFLDRVRS